MHSDEQVKFLGELVQKRVDSVSAGLTNKMDSCFNTLQQTIEDNAPNDQKDSSQDDAVLEKIEQTQNTIQDLAECVETLSQRHNKLSEMLERELSDKTLTV